MFHFNTDLKYTLVVILFYGCASIGDTKRHFYGINKYIAEQSTPPPTLPPIFFKQSRLCAANNDFGAPYRYHKPSRKCYVVGERGPCGELMEFTLVDRDYGTCDCSQKLRCGRPLIYWPQEKRCYYVNDQGPCVSGKWLTFGMYHTPVCKRNPCQAEIRKNPSRGSNFWFDIGGTCYKTGTQGLCPANHTLLNHWRSYKPQCTGPDEVFDCLIGQVHMTDCLPGMKMDHADACMRIKELTRTNGKNANPERIPNIYHLNLE